ncbi:MAG: hypothetical protein DRP01_10165 [Archaeoglobales archaeon]|nr:MAG: hypothetical protein DRP01_10165 [Archaeoglobales archaeon]
MDILTEVERVLSERGFKCLPDERGIVIPLRIDDHLYEFLFYEDSNFIRSLGIIYEFKSFVKDTRIIEEILKIPTKFRVSIGLDDEGDLIFEVWNNGSVESLLGAFLLFLRFVKWLRESLDDLKPFRL